MKFYEIYTGPFDPVCAFHHTRIKWVQYFKYGLHWKIINLRLIILIKKGQAS